MTADTAWMDSAHCLPLKQWQVFHLDEQRQICAGCPVRARCMKHGLAELELLPSGASYGEMDAKPDLYCGLTLSELAAITRQCSLPGCTTIARVQGRCRKHRINPAVPRHGTNSAYSYWKCRCDACLEWRRMEGRRARDAAKEATT